MAVAGPAWDTPACNHDITRWGTITAADSGRDIPPPRVSAVSEVIPVRK